MKKVGKYTAALLLVAVGVLLLIDFTMDTNWLGKAANWWPLIIIGLGLEYLILGLFARDPEKKVGIAFGNLFFSVLLSLGVLIFTQASSFNVFGNWGIHIGGISLADESGIKYEKETVVSLDSQVKRVKLQNHNGHVIMAAGDVQHIEIEIDLYVPKSLEDEAEDIVNNSKIVTNNAGSTLELRADGKEYRLFGVKQKPRMNLTVTVPRDHALDYELDLVNGKVQADGINIIDTFKADTTNGAIVISNMNGNVVADTTNGTVTVTDVKGDVHADTTNGKVILERISGVVNAETTNGSIEMNDVRDAVTADTTNGSVIVRTNQLGGNWKLDTTNGKIEVFLPEDASFQVKGETSWGKITSDFPLDIDKKNASGSVNGGTYKLHIDTNSSIGIYQN